MITKGIRGAITVTENTEASIREATIELVSQLVSENEIEINNISHVIFTTTSDLTKAFPAKYARTELGFENVAMMCFNELEVENSLQMCIRVLIVLNCNEDFIPKFVYLKGASNLRK